VFDCPVCGHANCLTCKAQHEGSTCRDYQDSLKRRAPVDVAAKKTQKKIEVDFWFWSWRWTCDHDVVGFTAGYFTLT